MAKIITERVPLGVYLHIPFCERKCLYCDFTSFTGSDAQKEAYVSALHAEIDSYKDISSRYLVKTIYFGGGTPTVLSAAQIGELINHCTEVFCVLGISKEDGNPKEKKGLFSFLKKEKQLKQEETEEEKRTKLIQSAEAVRNETLAEITVEMNPKTVDEAYLKSLREFGVNRVSVGMQSADDEELKLLGRIHTYEDTKHTYETLRKLGYSNVSLDLMSALPNQTPEKYLSSLKTVIELAPEHISSYSLSIEEGTPFHSLYGEGTEGQKLLPDEDADREMYHQTKTLLQTAGYHRYEISNYAKPGYESKHNSSYWTGIEYLGLGLGASSLLVNARYHNTDDFTAYVTGAKAGDDLRLDLERLVETEQMEEFMILGLRMTEGIKKSKFEDKFKRKIETVYGDVIKRLIREGVLQENGDVLMLTDYGTDVSNTVFAQFLLDDFVRR